MIILIRVNNSNFDKCISALIQSLNLQWSINYTSFFCIFQMSAQMPAAMTHSSNHQPKPPRKDLLLCFDFVFVFLSLLAAFLLFLLASIAAPVKDDLSNLWRHKRDQLMVPPPSPQVRNALHNNASRSPRVLISPGENQRDHIKLEIRLWVHSQQERHTAGAANQGWLKITTCRRVTPPRSAASAWRRTGEKKINPVCRRKDWGCIRIRSRRAGELWIACTKTWFRAFITIPWHTAWTDAVSERNKNGFWHINTLCRHRLRQKVEGIGSVKPQRAHK